MDRGPFPHVMILELRGKDLPIKDSWAQGGKADPYYTIRPAFGPGYRSPNQDQFDYEGDLTNSAIYTSSPVFKDLNPSWKPHALDLSSACGGEFDMDKKIIIDIWDKDLGKKDDFMGYIEVSFRSLVGKSQSKDPLTLLPPPKPHKQDVGWLYVEQATIGIPQVLCKVIQKKSKSSEALEFHNNTTLPLKVRLSDNVDEFEASKPGRIWAAAASVVEMDPGVEEMMGRPNVNRTTHVIVLSSLNFVLAKFTVGSYIPGSRDGFFELFLDLESISTTMYMVGPELLHSAQQAGKSEQIQTGSDNQFSLTMTLKLRGNHLPIKDNVYLGGKSDPYYVIRPAFGPGYKSPNVVNGKVLDPGSRTYEGKHTDSPPYQSEYIRNELNPVWKAQLIDINRICKGEIDLQKRLLIDVYDYDTPMKSDFMGYVEVSLQDLVNAARTGNPLQLLPPPPPHKQDVGRLYVETATLGFPQVSVNASPKRLLSGGMKICNHTEAPLKVHFMESVAEFERAEVGRIFKIVDQKSKVMKIDAHREIMLNSNHSTNAIFLNASNVIVSKRSVGSLGTCCLDLSMDLESGRWALSSDVLSRLIDSNYKAAVKRMDICFSENGDFAEADVEFFLERMQDTQQLLSLIPKFGVIAGDAQTAPSFMAYVNCQAELLERAIMNCEISGSNQESMELACKLSDKLSFLHKSFGNLKDDKLKDANRYADVQKMIFSKISSSVDEGVSALKENRFPVVASNLTDLKIAQKTRISSHLPPESESIPSMFQRLLSQSKEHLEKIAADANQILTKHSCKDSFVTDAIDVGKLKACIENLTHAQDTQWEDYLAADYIRSLSDSIQQSEVNCFDHLVNYGTSLLENLKLEAAKIVFDQIKSLSTLPGGLPKALTQLTLFSDLIISTCKRASAEVDTIVTKASSFVASDCEKSDGLQPNVTKVPTIINAFLDAKWIEECDAGAYRLSLETAQTTVVQKANSMLLHAQEKGSHFGEKHVQTLVYILDQFDALSQVKGDFLSALEASRAGLLHLLGDSVQKAEDEMKYLFPWCNSIEVKSVETKGLTFDAVELENMCSHIAQLSACLQGRNGMGTLQDKIRCVDKQLKDCIDLVISGIKTNLEALSVVNETEGLLEVQNADDLQACLRDALALNKHERLVRCFKGPNFVGATVQRLLGFFDKVSTALETGLKDRDMKRIQKLLKFVRPLCVLDDVSQDPSRMYLNLYSFYDKELKQRLESGESQILRFVETGKLKEAAGELFRLYKQDEVPCTIKTEVSNKISDMITSMDQMVRGLGRDLPSEQLKEIFTQWRALEILGSGESMIALASETIKGDYYRLMRKDDDEAGTSPKAGTVQKSLRQAVCQKVKAFESNFGQILSAARYQKAANMLAQLQTMDELEQLCGSAFCVSRVITGMQDLLMTSVDGRITKFKDVEVEGYYQNPPSEFFNLFKPRSDDGDIQPSFDISLMFKEKIESVWKDIERKIADRIHSADLGRGSRDLEVLDKAMQSLPDTCQKIALQELLTLEQTKAQAKNDEFDHALDSANAASALHFVLNCQPCVQAEYLHKLETKVRKAKENICNGLERQPCQLQFDREVINQWRFAHELKCETGVPEEFLNKLRIIFEDVRTVIGIAESDACTSLLALLASQSRRPVDPRFPEVEDTFAFMERLFLLRGELGKVPLGRDLLPENFGRHGREVCQSIVDDYSLQLQSLDPLFEDEPVEKPFEMSKILSLLKKLKSMQNLCMRSTTILQQLVNPNDPVVAVQKIATSDAIAKRVKGFILKNFKTHPDLTKKIPLSSERVRTFQLLGKCVGADQHLASLQEFVGEDTEVASVLSESFNAKLQLSVQQLLKEIQNRVVSIPDKAKIEKYQKDNYVANADVELELLRKTCEEINMMHDHLELFQQHVSPCMSNGVNFDLRILQADLIDKMNGMANQIEDVPRDDLDGLAGVLVCLQVQKQELLFQGNECKCVVDHCLEKYQATEAGKGTAISKLGFKLAGGKFRPYGEQIAQTYDAFQGYRAAAFRRKTEAYKEEDVIKDMKASGQIGRGRLLDLFKEFDREYRSIIEQCLRDGFGEAAGSFVITKLRDQLKRIHIQHSPKRINWTQEMKDAVPTMVARIFAVWTFHHSKRFLKAMEGADKASYLFMPHPVQVIAIFCLMGLDNQGAGRGPSCDIERNLVQVRTGEGKTAVLGVAACVFALFKVRVNCACYSEYLSNRDFNSLEFLFKALDVQSYISYCTLVRLCRAAINSKINIGEEVAAVILGKTQTAAAIVGRGGSGQPGEELSPRVLLVDEVDVFFTKDFYGNTYNQACELRHEKISDLVRQIWDEGPSKELNLDIVKGWPQYNALCLAFPSWVFLIDSSIIQMIEDLSEFADHKYEVINGKIGYREQDGVVFNVSERYLTVFAHLKEGKSGGISETEMKKNIKLLIQCGHFLYAKLPCEFDLVLGVTGTLETLSEEEKTIVRQEYAITRFVYMPSVYGINVVKLKGITLAKSPDIYIKSLVQEIEKYSVQSKQSVIVFFETKEGLMSFWKCDAFKEHKNGQFVHVLLEEMRADEKQQIISCRSGGAGAITLATRPFGRGTDFSATDDSVNQAGGIHVVQSFLPDTQSEEIQIKGRTARQGEKGSFSMVLLQSDVVDKFGLDEGFLDGMARDAAAEEAAAQQLLAALNLKRIELCEAGYKKLVSFVKDNEGQHLAAQQFATSLEGGDIAEVTRFLRAQIPPAQPRCATGKARILVLMDATGSMGGAMRAAKDTISEMFDRATKILQDLNFGGGGSELFEMQFAVYRNYSSGANLLLEHSEWRSNPQDLKAFLSKVSASGGQGNEAVEVGLWHANGQADLKQVVLIGDARANSPGEVAARRAGYGAGEALWAKTQFAQPTGFEAETARLAKAGVLVDTFFLGRGADAVANFAAMAAATGGEAHVLDICTPAGARELVDSVTPRILLHVGGAADGSKLVGAYHARFKMRA